MNNCDIRCGLLMKIEMNVNFVENMLEERGDYAFDLEENYKNASQEKINAFWSELNDKCIIHFTKPSDEFELFTNIQNELDELAEEYGFDFKGEGIDSEDEEEVEEEEDFEKKYDYTKISIASYIALLRSLKRRLTNMRCSCIPLERRKKSAFDTMMKYVKEKTGEDLQMWKDKLDITFGIVEQPVIKSIKPPMDLSAFKVGDIVFADTEYKEDKSNGGGYSIRAKCKITKINKSSLTLTKYNYVYDDSEVRGALQFQTYCNVYYIWKDTLSNEKMVIRNPKKLLVKGDGLYDTQMKKSSYFMDFGN